MMREKTYDYPFTAIVGQEPMKEAILINLVNPSAGGVLIRGQKGTAKTTAVRAIPGLMKDCRVVEIPANATEDRVAGTIDIEAALKDGEKQFQPGLLKEADGNILYVDEINLLDDHIVDLLLDAAATGRNTVERRDFLYPFCPVCTDRFHEPGGGKPAAAASGPFWHGGGCGSRDRRG